MKKTKEQKITGRNPDCKLCRLHKTSCEEEKNFVCLWGYGNKDADIVFVGEAPGADEIVEEIPFVGSAGQLLSKYLKIVGIKRPDVWITNTVKCRPEENRKPKPMEVRACTPYLDYEIATIKPKVIAALGAVALNRVLGVDGITRLRGKPAWSVKYNCWCVPTWHPSYIMRNGEELEQVEQFIIDLKLIKQIGETGETGQLGTNVTVANTPKLVTQLFNELSTKKVFSVDTETDGDYLTGKILTVQFSWKPGEAWVLPLIRTTEMKSMWKKEQYDTIINNLKKILENEKFKKVGQNIKYDYQFFKLYGIELKGVVFDTMLAHFLLDENAKGKHSLEHLGLSFTDMGSYSNELYQILGLSGSKDVDEFTMAKAPFDALCKYGAKDADCTFRVYQVLFGKIKSQGLLPLLSKIMIPLSFALGDMEMAGVAVDVDYYKKLAIEYAIKIEEVLKKLHEFEVISAFRSKKNEPINIGSHDQLRVLLYDILKLPIVKYVKNKKKKTKGPRKASTDASVLEQLAEYHSIPKLILEFRKLSHFLSTYIKPVPKLVKSDGRLHTSYLQQVAVTGRLSSRNPNLQNIPKKEPEKAAEIRRGIVAGPGYAGLIEADYAQIEFRLLINECKDEQGIADIKNGLDIHKTIASSAYDIPYDEVTQETREPAKTINYSVIYGKSKENLAKETGLTVDQVEKVFEALFTRYPRIKPYTERQKRRAQTVGEVVNWVGRRRRLADGFKSSVDFIRAEAERQAVNAPIQGGAHDIVSVGTIRVARKFKELGLKSRLIMTIHDAIIAEYTEEEQDTVIDVLKTEMEKPVIRINVPMKVDIKIGKRLSEMKKLEETKV